MTPEQLSGSIARAQEFRDRVLSVTAQASRPIVERLIPDILAHLQGGASPAELHAIWLRLADCEDVQREVITILAEMKKHDDV
jgi:hypothetical protein